MRISIRLTGSHERLNYAVGTGNSNSQTFVVKLKRIDRVSGFALNQPFAARDDISGIKYAKLDCKRMCQTPLGNVKQ